ncbi:MAG: hypothetical protein GX930_03735, partial [Clostridia bacterium]|nr:hypothetical protein [Clostridia bacterium]
MAKLRVYELAKELSMESREVIRRLGIMGLELKNHMSTVDDKFADQLREMVKPGPSRTFTPPSQTEQLVKKTEKRGSEKSPDRKEARQKVKNDNREQSRMSRSGDKSSYKQLETKLSEHSPRRAQGSRVDDRTVQRQPGSRPGDQRTQKHQGMQVGDNRQQKFSGSKTNEQKPSRYQGSKTSDYKPLVRGGETGYQKSLDVKKDNLHSRTQGQKSDEKRQRSNGTDSKTSKPLVPDQQFKKNTISSGKKQFKTELNQKDLQKDNRGKGRKKSEMDLPKGKGNQKGKGNKRQYKKGNLSNNEIPAAVPKKVVIGESIIVSELAKGMGKTSAEIIKKLMEMGTMATINQEIDADTAVLIAEEFAIPVEVRVDKTMEIMEDQEEKEEDLI